MGELRPGSNPHYYTNLHQSVPFPNIAPFHTSKINQKEKIIANFKLLEGAFIFFALGFFFTLLQKAPISGGTTTYSLLQSIPQSNIQGLKTWLRWPCKIGGLVSKRKRTTDDVTKLALTILSIMYSLVRYLGEMKSIKVASASFSNRSNTSTIFADIWPFFYMRYWYRFYDVTLTISIELNYWVVYYKSTN